MSFKKATSDLKRRFCTDEALTGTDDQESRAAPFDAIRKEIKQITPVIVDEGPVAKKSSPALGMDFLLAGSLKILRAKMHAQVRTLSTSSRRSCKLLKRTTEPTLCRGGKKMLPVSEQFEK